MTYTPNTYTDFKNSVRVASTGNVNVSSPGASIDGVALAANNRVLLKNQSTPAQNGIYNWMGAATPMVRAKDADQSGELTPGAASYIESGTVNAKKTFTLTTTGAIVVGTTPLVYEELTPNLNNSSLNDLGDVDTTGVVDGALLRYEATGTDWLDTTTLLLTDAGQLQVTTTGIAGGIMLGGDAQLYRSGANTLRTDGTLNINGAATISGTGVISVPASSGTLDFNAQSVSTNAVVTSRVAADPFNRFITRASGELLWGSGALAADVSLSRTAANIIAMGAGDKIQQNAAPTAPDDLVNLNYLTTTFSTTLDGLSDVDTAGVVDGSLLRYEATGTVWNDTSALLFSDAGQLQVTTTGIAAGIVIGGDTHLYRSAANILTVGAGDKVQQNAAPTVNDDITNKFYVDNAIAAATPDFNQAFRRSWFGVG